jgi:hypothetical protein
MKRSQTRIVVAFWCSFTPKNARDESKGSSQVNEVNLWVITDGVENLSLMRVLVELKLGG